MLRTKLGLTVLLAGALAVLAIGTPALAKDGDVIRRANCSVRSDVKLKLSEENGRIETEVEVDQNRNGVQWRVVITRDGAPVASATRVTRGPSGSFELRRVLANPAGADVIRAVATRRGERCAVSATWNA
jgi:hypothetical protein